jgi:hypothetical protein
MKPGKKVIKQLQFSCAQNGLSEVRNQAFDLFTF